MRKIFSRTLPLIGFLFLFCTAFGQDRLAPDNRKYKQSYALLCKLYQSDKDTFANAHLPTFIIKVGKTRLENFLYDAKNQSITISEDLYDFCIGLGNDSLNALAFVLAHELAHHYQRKEGNFACIFQENSPQFTVEDCAKEKEADIYGHYTARLAGFSPCEIGANLMDKLYERFHIANSPKYPPLEQRKQMITDACQNADTLVSLYECAIYASLLGKYDISSELYTYLLRRFPNKKMYYSAAISKLMYVRESLMEKQHTIYDFPLLLDFKSDIRSENEVEQGNSLNILQESEYLLRELKRKYPDDEMAAYYLLYAKHLQIVAENPDGNTPEQQALLKEFEQLQQPTCLSSQGLYSLLKGIFLSFSGSEEDAKQAWESVLSNTTYFEIARENLRYLAGEKTPPLRDCKLKAGLVPYFSLEPPQATSKSYYNSATLNICIFDSIGTHLCHIKSNDFFIKLKGVSFDLPNAKITKNSSVRDMEDLSSVPCKKAFSVDNKIIYIDEKEQIIFIFDEKQKWETTIRFVINRN